MTRSAGPRVDVTVLVDNHWHRGQRVPRGSVITLRTVHMAGLAGRVKPVAPPLPDVTDDLSPAKPDAPTVEHDTATPAGDEDDPDPEPEPSGPALSEASLRLMLMGGTD